VKQNVLEKGNQTRGYENIGERIVICPKLMERVAAGSPEKKGVQIVKNNDGRRKGFLAPASRENFMVAKRPGSSAHVKSI